jgi:hypothetical protein
VLPHQAYSLDLGPSNFHLFPRLKEDLRGQNFSSDEEVKAAVCQWFREKEKDFLRMEFKNLLNVGKSVLKLKEIMLKSDCGQWQIGVKGTFIFLIPSNIFLPSCFI